MIGEEMASDKKQKKTVNTAWIFDVDGVITNLVTKKITEPQILDFIVNKLEIGESIAFNSGRGLEWMIENVINLLLLKIKNKNVLGNFFAVGEKGGTWLTINRNEEIKKNMDPSLQIPLSLLEKIRAFGIKYSNRMIEYEKTKKTMFAFEMKTGLNPKEFKKLQAIVVPEIEKIIKKNQLSDKLIVDPTRIGTDIQYRQVGKGFATKRILNWLRDKGITAEKVITFGDSKSDFEMAEETQSEGVPTIFVYVGGDGAFDNIQTDISIFNTKNKFEQGTLEYLKSL